jgi:hypothetical protein
VILADQVRSGETFEAVAEEVVRAELQAHVGLAAFVGRGALTAGAEG